MDQKQQLLLDEYWAKGYCCLLEVEEGIGMALKANDTDGREYANEGGREGEEGRKAKSQTLLWCAVVFGLWMMDRWQEMTRTNGGTTNDKRNGTANEWREEDRKERNERINHRFFGESRANGSQPE